MAQSREAGVRQCPCARPGRWLHLPPSPLPPHPLGLRQEEAPKHTPISPPPLLTHTLPVSGYHAPFRGHRGFLLQEALPDVLVHRCLSVRAHPCPGAPGLPHRSVHARTCPPCLCSPVHTASVVLRPQQPVSRPPTLGVQLSRQIEAFLVTGLRESGAHRSCLPGEQPA